MASIELREKNGVMSEVVRIAEFGVYGHDTVVSMKITEKGYREGYGVWEEDNSSYYYFNVLGDEKESFDFASAEFERIMTRWGKFDWIRIDKNTFEIFYRNVMESSVHEDEDLSLVTEKLDKFLTFAIELNNINKG